MAILGKLAPALGRAMMGAGGRTATAAGGRAGGEAIGATYAGGRGFVRRVVEESSATKKAENLVLRAQGSKIADWNRKLGGGQHANPGYTYGEGGAVAKGGAKASTSGGRRSGGRGGSVPSGAVGREEFHAALGHKTVGIGRLGHQVRGSEAWLGRGVSKDLLGHGIEKGLADVPPNWRQDMSNLTGALANRGTQRRMTPKIPSTELVHVPGHESRLGLPEPKVYAQGRGEMPGNPIVMPQGGAPNRVIKPMQWAEGSARQRVGGAPLELGEGSVPLTAQEAQQRRMGRGASSQAIGKSRRSLAGIDRSILGPGLGTK